MPYYKLKDTQSGKVWTELMGISECEEYLEKNPHVERMYNGGPALVSGTGTVKSPDSFRDLLKHIKKKTKGDFNIY